MTRVLLGTVIVWTAFLGIGLYSSSRFSPYFQLSLVWLWQYSFMYFVATGICLGLMTQPRFKKYLMITISGVLCTQFVVSMLQLIFQRSVGLPFEAFSAGTFATGLDENNAVFRVMATFMMANQLALVVGLLSSLLLPYALQKKSILYSVIACFGFITIILTQSRSVMIGSALVVLLNLRVYSAEVLFLLRKVGIKRIAFLALSAFILSAFSLIPRVILSVNTGYEGAGLAIRLRMFEEAIEAIIGSPLVGYGVGTNEYVLHRLFPDGVMSVFPAVVHMTFLQLWLEIGLVGLIILLLPFLYLLRFAIVVGRKYSSHKYFRLGYIGGLLLNIVFWIFLPHIGIVEFPFLGIVLGFGGYWYYLSVSVKGKDEKTIKENS